MNDALTAVFVEPKGSLLGALRERKAWMEATLPGQPYCNHPPHCTLIVGDYGREADWIGRLRSAMEGVRGFEMQTDGWQLFRDDPLAGGGQTVAFRALLTPELATLQLNVAEVLRPFLRAPAEGHPLCRIEPFSTSLSRYGFPFVGPHWIPHFTIASPLVRPEARVVSDLMSGPVSHGFPVSEISVWRVKGDDHERIHTLALSRKGTGNPSSNP